MESRARTILPIVAILLVLLIALTAFFITRRIRNAATQSQSPQVSGTGVDLVIPSLNPTVTGSTGTPRPTLGAIRRQPVTGPDDEITNEFSVAFDNTGFRESQTTVTKGTKVTWINLGSTAQTLSFDNISTGSIEPGKTFSYLFSEAQKYTVTTGAGHTHTIIVR